MLEPAQPSEFEPNRKASAIIMKGGPTAVHADRVMPLSGGGAAEAEPSGDHDHSELNLLWVIRRDKWVILAVFLLLSAASVPIILWKVAPTYRATALVRVSPVVSRIVFKTEDNGIVPLFWSYVNTQVAIIHSSRVLLRVLERKDVRQTGWYKGFVSSTPDGSTSPSLENIDLLLSVEAQPRSELIEVSAVTGHPLDASVIANAVVDEYKTLTEASLSDIDTHRLKTLMSERKTLRLAIDNLVKRRFELSNKKELGTADPEDLRTQLSVQRSNLESERETSKREAALTKWELRMLRSAEDGEEQTQEKANGTENQPVTALLYAADTEWRKLNFQMETDRHGLQLARQRFGERHPKIEALVSTVQHDRELLQERERQLKEGVAIVPSETQSAYRATPESAARCDPKTLEWLREKQLQDLKFRQEEIDHLDKKMAKVGDLAQRLSQLDEEIRQKREIFDTVRNRLTALEMESKAPARVSIAAFAQQPFFPFNDKRRKLTVAALGAALIMAIGIAILRTRFNPKIWDSSDVQDNVRVPFLGQLFEFPSTIDLFSCSNPSLIEGMRMVRTALLNRLKNTDLRVILLTSSSSDCGKTSAAVLLGRSLASLGKKTLLVETDFRRPSFCKRLNLDARVGLASILTGNKGDGECIIPTTISGLDVVVAGDLPSDFDFELLANGEFTACLKRWRQRYDFILLDSPPVLPVADASILAGQADGVIMILRASHSRRGEVLQAYADLGAAGGTLLGTILLSAQPVGGMDYYTRSYEPDVRLLTAKTKV